MNRSLDSSLDGFVRDRFNQASIPVQGLAVRQFPNESVVIVEVLERDFFRAVELANSLR